ncbi:MAG: replicative DNA helicase [Anaerolineae bacterium]|nr:replicative DNA helicase [Anaerolineae bacterium]
MATNETRTAPHSVEAEEAVLGSILINPETLLDVNSVLSADDFFIIRHRWIWEAIQRLHLRREAIDYLTVVRELDAHHKLEDVGGPAYLTYLINNTPTSIHAETYARTVVRIATRRRLLAAAGEIAELAYEEETEIEEVIDSAESALLTATERHISRELTPIDEVISNYYDRVEYLYTHQDETHGVPTGFTDLDRMLGGMQRSDLLVVAGRPGMGKSSWLISAALNAARYGSRVAVFSLEMSNEQVVQRIIAAETGLNSQQLRLGHLSPDDWERFIQAADRLSKLNVYLDDTPALSITQLRTKCRRQWAQTGLDLAIVDYLQLMNAGQRVDNRVQEISMITMGLKQIAREMNLPMLAAAQLSRAVEQRQDKRPLLSDLRESGSIEQDSDVVMFLYRDEMYNDDTEKPNIAEVIVAKHRNGPTGAVELFFKKELTQFTDLYRRQRDLNAL